MHINYTWDASKRLSNLDKHGVDFTAMDQFDWVTALVLEDTRAAYGEIRIRAMGLVKGRLHVAVLTERAGHLRLISLRKANKREQRQWENT